MAGSNSTKAQLKAVLDAVSRSQAMIEFELDGTIVTANDNFLSVMGYTLDEIRGKHHRIFVDREYGASPEYLEFWQRLGAGEYDSGVYKRFGKDGQAIWIQASYNPILDLNGRPCRVVKCAADVTASRLQAADYEGQIQAISKSQAVIEFDLDGHILAANDNFLGAMGYALDEIVGQHHGIFVEPAFRQSEEYARFWERLRQGHHDSGEYRRIGRDGRSVWIQATYNPILDSDGQPFKVVKYASDITGQKTAVEALRRSVMALSEGDVTVRIEEDVEPAFEALKAATNQTLSRLQDLVTQIDGSARRVANGASEVAQSSQNLRQRTSEQADALRQTATTVQDLAGTVRQNADGSSKASELANRAQRQAEQGGKVVEKAIVAMGAINEASEKIANIIVVIDEIAFQTNLVALNAAVEAARAADQGRGFAVVAGEVRNLAQQCAEAAKEIKTLIRDSVHRVTEGSGLVHQSGNTLEQIVRAVRQVSELISDIAEKGQQQAVAIEEVNTVVQQLQGVTEENAALVVQTATVATTMDGEADRVLENMRFFSTLDASESESATSRPQPGGNAPEPDEPVAAG